MGLIRLVLLVITLLTLLVMAVGGPQIARPNCKDYCGNIMIPYPFGMESKDCYKDEWFEINCTNKKPFLPRLGMEVLNISLPNDLSPYIEEEMSGVIVKGPIINNCTGIHGSRKLNLTDTPFLFNDFANILVAVGCDTSVLMNNHTTAQIVGCNTKCILGQNPLVQYLKELPKVLPISNGLITCNGSNNCCYSSISGQVKVFNPTFKQIDGNRPDECSLTFLAIRRWNYSSQLHKEKQLNYVPLQLSWITEIDYDGRGLGKEINCLGFSFYKENTTTISSSECACAKGYEGNPNLGTSGCKDIDECKGPKRDRCKAITKCVNTRGSFKCVVNPIWIIVIILAGVSGFIAVLFCSWLVYKLLKKRSKKKMREKCFKRNGGLLLQQQVTSVDGSLQKTKIFSSKELEKATDKFNKNRILGQGGQGIVYKGMLIDGRIVAVKKSTLVDEENLQGFINEVVILSQINHRHVVKLLGCCLETEVPLLVYEFIPNGTLFQYIHDQQGDDPLSWELRLQIATEAAGAIAYLHWATSIPIYHRDIKSTNILLDEKFRAKVSDFGTSRSITVDQTHLTTRVQGTMGYLDPEYFQSGQFTAKSDVYSFGVVLLELLSGQKPISWVRPEESRSLATSFNLLMEENKLFEIIDYSIMEEKHKQQIIAVANLAKRCLNLSGRFRPNMKEVAIELEHIWSSSTTEAIVSNASPSVVSCDFKDSMSLMSFEVEPLISNQTW